LEYTDDDGTLVEPEYYVPILPFCLVNGISGIGTGFSCDVPSYDPKAIIAYLKAKLYASPLPIDSFAPYYEGFKGSVSKTSGDRWLIKGVYERVGDDSLRITELPIGTWTMSYITMLEGLLDGGVDKAGKKIAPVLKDMINMSTEVLVDITVTFQKGDLAKLLSASPDPAGITAVEKLLKLTTTVSESNMHLFDADCRLHKYQSVEEIIDAFYDVRMRTYQKRKDALVANMRDLLVKLSNRARYIQATLRDEIDLRRKSNVQVLQMLEQMAYDKIDGDYKYLIKMPMDSVTDEHATKIMKEHEDTQHELAILLGTSLRDMWVRELDSFEKEYDVYRTKRAALLKPTKSGTTASKTKSTK
jgi:DNA topoisomerase-2